MIVKGRQLDTSENPLRCAAILRQASDFAQSRIPAGEVFRGVQATSFDRLARTVRRTIALARKLSEPAREAPGPKLRLNECPLQECPEERRPDCAETDAFRAELCECPEGADCDADEDLDDDLD